MIFDYVLFNSTLKRWVLSLRHKRRLYYSRKISKSFLKKVRKLKGASVIEKKTEKRIEAYAKKRFGDIGYAHWLFVYTELRGEFKEGWIPDDFFAYELLPFLNDEHISHLSEVKSLDHSLFAPHAIVPVAKKINGIFFDAKNKITTENLFIKEIRDTGGEVVIKKDNVQSGFGVQFVKAENVTSGHFPAGCDYLVQPSVRQQPELYKVHQYSVSTIRVTTYIDPSGNVQVKHRSLRFGEKDHRMVNQSGLFLFLGGDGKVSSNIYSRIGLDLGSLHPDTGFNLRNFRVPSVPRAVKICKKMHLRFPYLRFIAWDLYIDEEGNPKIIEWNTIFPGMWENEALIGPLWSEEEIDEVLDAGKADRGQRTPCLGE